MKPRRHLVCSIFFLCCLFSCSRVEAVKISVLEPSALELVMAAKRDFYVIGRLDRESRSATELPVDIRVEVAITGSVRAGEKFPIRTVRSCVDRNTGLTPERDIYFDYDEATPQVNLSRGELMKSPPPDLVYRHGDIASFYDPSVKAAVTEDSFAVLVQGGVTKDYETDYEKVYSEDLEWKLFRVSIDAMSGDEVLDSRELDIMFGSVQDKILANFEPPPHLAAVTAFAGSRGLRLYKNLLPGYWDFKLPAAYEIPLRHRRNLALEYLEGRVHALLYNIDEDSLTQRVGIGHIAFKGWLDTDEIYFYRYDIGEPCLTHIKWGKDERREGMLTRFRCGDRLALTRAEIIDSGDAERGYFPAENIGKAAFYPFAAVILKPGETCRLYGVATPIQPRLSEVAACDDATFDVQNRVDKIRYLFEDMTEGVLHTEEHAVGLTRFYDEGESSSIYEFRHTLTLPETLRGRVVTVFVSAFDRHGEPAGDSQEAFYLYIAK